MTLAPVIALRPITPADHPLLLEIFASTREAEMARVPWSPEQKAAFLGMQFQAQHADYQRNYPDASFDVIEQDGVPAGRLYVHRRPEEIRVIDIALLPAFRGQGLGTRFLTELIEEAAATARVVSIHVEKNNPALRLYQRLAFEPVADTGVHLLMRHTPQSLPSRP